MDRQPQSITEVVAATLREMGLAADAAALTRTILIRDGYFAGHKYRFDGLKTASWKSTTTRSRC
jgi:hypothetical protein